MDRVVDNSLEYALPKTLKKVYITGHNSEPYLRYVISDFL